MGVPRCVGYQFICNGYLADDGLSLDNSAFVERSAVFGSRKNK